MSASPTDIAIGGLKQRLDQVDGGREPASGRLAVLEERTGRLERQRSRLARTVMILSAALLLLTGVIIAILVERTSARDYYNDQLRRLACMGVEAHRSTDDPTIRTLRDHYHCPPYKAPAPKPHRTASPNPHAHAVSPIPGPTRTLTAPAGPRPTVGPTRTPGHAVPSTSASPSGPARPSSSPSSTPTAPKTTPNPIGKLVCRILGLVVPCRTEQP